MAITQLNYQWVVTTVRLLVAGGLLVAAVGATMGAMLGLERVIGQFLPIEIAMGSRHGAVIMGVGVLLGAITMLRRLVSPNGP